MDTKRILLCAHLALALMLISFTGASSDSSSPSSSSSSSNNNNHNHHRSSSTATQARQSPMSAAASMVGALGSLVPGLITNVAPLVLLVGLGAMMMPSLGMSAMNLLRESRRSAHDQQPLASMQLPAGPFAQYGARPIQTSPQDIYYFTKRSLPSLVSNFNSEPLRAGLSDLLERVARALENVEKRYN